jgi:threonine dehydrogenase-like Zn-dependent dehydrogenase
MKGYGMISVDNVGWIEKDKPVLTGGDAILRPIAVAPCTSDTHTSHGGAGPKENLILGHEAIGEVVEVADDVKHFKPGDIVVVPCVTPDWSAKALQDGYYNEAHDVGLMQGFKFLNSKDGVFAEFFHVNNADSNLVLKPENVSIEQALMTVDMMSTGFCGAEMADVKYGDTVVVFGIGPVGLMAVAGAALRGAGEIIAIGTRPDCIALAKEYGATKILSYKEGDLADQVRAIYPEGVDCTIIAGGTTENINQSLRMVKANGTISNINYFDVSEDISFPAALWGLGMADIKIVGGFCRGGAKRIERMLNIIAAKRLDPGKLLNYKYEGFDKIEEAFKVMDENPEI